MNDIHVDIVNFRNLMFQFYLMFQFHWYFKVGIEIKHGRGTSLQLSFFEYYFERSWMTNSHAFSANYILRLIKPPISSLIFVITLVDTLYQFARF